MWRAEASRHHRHPPRSSAAPSACRLATLFPAAELALPARLASAGWSAHAKPVGRQAQKETFITFSNQRVTVVGSEGALIRSPKQKKTEGISPSGCACIARPVLSAAPCWLLECNSRRLRGARAARQLAPWSRHSESPPPLAADARKTVQHLSGEGRSLHLCGEAARTLCASRILAQRSASAARGCSGDTSPTPAGAGACLGAASPLLGKLSRRETHDKKQTGNTTTGEWSRSHAQKATPRQRVIGICCAGARASPFTPELPPPLCFKLFPIPAGEEDEASVSSATFLDMCRAGYAGSDMCIKVARAPLVCRRKIGSLCSPLADSPPQTPPAAVYFFEGRSLHPRARSILLMICWFGTAREETGSSEQGTRALSAATPLAKC